MMHEYSIVGSLIERVESEAARSGATAVKRLWVSIGDLSGVDRELLATAYDTFRERTICEGAELRVTPVAARWSCPRCAQNIEPGAMLRCSACNVPATLSEGDEIVLERIEMEVN
jgi:hydrogenase nickel incorporation protein HypA/HybF